MVESRVVSIAIFGLLQENVSLVTIELVTYLCAFVLMLHVHSSGKRNATMLVAAALQIILVDLVLFSGRRWHAQAWLMLLPERLPLYNVLLQAQLYYMAFVATSRLRIDNVLQPIAMGLLVAGVMLPFELLGGKFIWWTYHDTDPLLVDRFYTIPFHTLFTHLCFGMSFLTSHHMLCKSDEKTSRNRYWLLGDYYEEEHWKREWGYAVALPLFSLGFGIFFFIIFNHVFVQALGIPISTWFVIILGLCLLIFWMADREKDEAHIQEALAPVDAYDSDWLYPCIDHAVNQMMFIYTFILGVLVCLVDPSEIVSVGHHQALGNCVEEESFRSLIGIRFDRKKYLCVHEFDEEFNLCNYPLAQMNYEESWYMICGRGFSDKAAYAALVISSIVILNLLFFQILKRPKKTRTVSFTKKYI
ncbi:TPA: hypothetical protein N0F65_010320 [Lagenidium giganteum]|uniref:DUF7802 domain-containing protein n=1 Tax=Lagenidium giganteum TaxID=4803 RepID=A0AAV2Z803_9STRA|nr:TPA: hypothetical protein N0F65_010320 [Lagenidium giganteum]